MDLESVFKSHQMKALALRKGSIQERKLKIESILNWLMDHQSQIQKAIYDDMKKSPEEVNVSELFPLMSEGRLAISHLKKWTRPKRVKSGLTFLGTKASIYYEPMGCCLIISPWNYPLQLAIGPLISAIAAGNTIMLKPSEFSPATNAIMRQMIHELFEENEVALFEGDSAVASALLALPFDHIFFTGSPAVGKIVMSAAAKNLTSVTLELGGKSPTIVDDTADIEDTAEKITWGKWLNAGQTCIAPDYLFVHEKVKDQLLEAIARRVKVYEQSEIYTGIISQKHFDRLNTLLEDGKEKGGKLIFGGESDRTDCKIAPALLDFANPDMILMQEEIFGPILPVLTYSKLDEVVDYINARPKPLALYLYSGNKENQRRIIRETSAGGTVINDNVLQFGHPYLPMGGVNNSGIGKSHGFQGFVAFSHPKSVLKQRTGMTIAKMVYPPYTPLKKKIIAWMLKYF